MSSSDSEYDDRITDWSHRCTCNRYCCEESSNDDDDDDDDDYETDSEESFEAEDVTDDSKIVFISIFNDKTQKNKNFVCDALEIQNYRDKYKELPLKNIENIKRIWAQVKIDMPVLGQMPLKQIDKELIEDTKVGNNNNKKKFKKPTHLMQKPLDTPVNDSANKSEKIAQFELKQINGKLSQAQVNKGNDKKPEILKTTDLNKKLITTPKSISNQNKNPNNESNVSKKLTSPVSDKLIKTQALKANIKSNDGKTAGSDPNAVNIKTDAENSNKEKLSNSSNKKLSLENNSIKVNPIKISQNPIDQSELKSGTALPLTKKMESKEKLETAKINLTVSNTKSTPKDKVQKVEKSLNSEVKTSAMKADLTKASKKPNAENKMEKHDSINSNLKSNEKDKSSNYNLNNKSLKSEVDMFKKPDSNKIIPLSKNNKKETTMFEQNLQSNENNSAKKLTKKQEKKRRQREKKLDANYKDTSSSSRDLSVSSNNSCNDKASKNNLNKNVQGENKPRKKLFTKSETKTKHKKSSETENSDAEEMDVEQTNTSCDDLDLLTDTEYIPTFIADILKRKEKNKQLPKPVTETPTKRKGKKNKNEQEKIKIEKEEEFIVHAKKNKNFATPDQNYVHYSEIYGEEGVDMILDNNLMAALEYITIAIDYNPSDYRHYLNRAYCYLKMHQAAYALTDAQYVIRLCTNIGHLFIANLRAGQAAFALKNYKQAECFLKEANRINPENWHAVRELIRAKLSQIMSCGYKEQDALTALQKYPSTLEATNYLNKNKKNLIISNSEGDFKIDGNNYNNMVFVSDDEEETNNYQTLNRMMNYQPGTVKFKHLVAKPINSKLVLGSNNCSKTCKPQTTPDVKRKGASTTNNKAVWVGSLTNDITDQMLKKKFKQFGNVISVYRPCNEAYAFINFEKSEDVTKTLINSSAHEIAGIRLVVRSAVRSEK